MLNNAGHKIVFWSKVVLYAGIALSLVGGFWFIWNGAQTNVFRYSVYHMGYLYNTGYMGGARTILMGILIIVIGSLLSWLWALLLRAFGDIAVDTRAIREHLEWADFHAEADEPEADKPEEPVKPKTRRPAKPKPEAPAEPESTEAPEA